MPETELELHDSWLLGVEISPHGTGALVFNAVVYRKNKEREDHSEEGQQRIQMAFTQMAIEGDVSEPEIDIYEGSLKVDAMLLDNIIPYPASYTGSVRLQMTTRQGVDILVEGNSIKISPVGEFVATTPHSWQ